MTVNCHNAWMSGAYLPISVPRVTVGAAATFHGVQTVLRHQPCRRKIHRYLAQRLVQHGGLLASVDRPGTALAFKLFGLPERSFSIVANGVAESSGKGARLIGGELTVGHIGTLSHGKGWRVTAEAVSALRRDRIPVRFTVAGSGPDIKEAEAWCRDHSDHCDFRGQVRNAVANVMPDLDVFVLPSLWEGMSMAALEAPAAGVPVLKTPVGGPPKSLRMIGTVG